MMLWGITSSAYWGDEADSVSAVSRSLPQLVAMLRHVDAVHGLYYLLLWLVAQVAGTGELATRLPSAVAMAAAALGVAAIARRLRGDRAALCAGIVFAVLPMISTQGHDARPYGMVTATAVLASYLLVRAVADPRRRWFAAYGVSLALLGYLELFGLLLIVAHAITLIGLSRRGAPPDGADGNADWPPGGAVSRRTARRWLVATAIAVLAVLPVAVYGWLQRAQIAWIAKPGWHDALGLVTSLGAGAAASAVLIGLAVVGGLRGGSPALPRRAWPRGRPVPTGPARPRGPVPRASGTMPRLTWLALPWLVMPPALLLAASEVVPAYNVRYVVFCWPGAALLAGAGLAALGPILRAVALALTVALVLPAQLSIRAPWAGMRGVSQFVAARARPGDAVIYPGSGVPPWYLAYPDGLGRLRDIWMAESGPASGRLYGVRVPASVLARREQGVCRIWAVEVAPPWQDPAPYLTPSFRLAAAWQSQPGVRIWLYQRPGCGSPRAIR